MAKKRLAPDAIPRKPADKPAASRSAAKRRLAEIDRAIVSLLAERADAVRGLVAEGEAPSPADPTPTAAQAGPAGAVRPEAIAAVLREVAAATLGAVRPTRVAYLGPEDSFSHLTAIARFGEAADLAPVATISAVFEEVARGTCQFGVAPLENSTHGRVTDTLECLARHEDVEVCGEAPMRIHHCLLGRGKRSEVRRVVSKPQALDQCRHWLATHLPGATPEAAASTSDAARLAAQDPQVAAIASERAGRRYGLAVLAGSIEDHPDNLTRFAVIARKAADGSPPAKKSTRKSPGGEFKTSLVFEAPHRPGALADAMAIFKRQGLNLTWIESFPIPGSRTAAEAGGRYLFFVEFQGRRHELRVRRALAALETKCLSLRVLGSYAQAEALG